ncbi:MAG TPA: hypothetical protein VIY49_25255 [Bryobacteraceae bacterium]
MSTRARVFRSFPCVVAGCLLAGAVLVNPSYGQQPAIPLVGTVATVSPAETVAVNGNIVYTCDDNEISIIDVTKPSTPAIVTTLGSPADTANTYCDVQKGDLVQMINTSTPSFRAYSLTNPTSPSLFATATVDKTFFGPPYYQGNTAFFGMNEIVFRQGYPGPITDQAGDFVSMDVTNFNSPVILGALESQTHGSVADGSFNVYGTTPYSNTLVYIASTSSQGAATQTGNGQTMGGRHNESVVDVDGHNRECAGNAAGLRAVDTRQHRSHDWRLRRMETAVLRQ